MKISGQAQAEVIKIVTIGAAAALAVWAVKKGIGAAKDTISHTLADAADAVLAAPGKIYQAVIYVDNPPFADLGTYSQATEAEWQRREAAAAAGAPVSGWEKFKYDITHIFNF